MMKLEKTDLSIILPAFNEANTLENSVKKIRNIMGKTKYNYEIIIAEDGSTDGTDKIARKLEKRYENVAWLHSDERLGRGKAVANAIKKSNGRIVGFIDIDLEVSPKYIPILAKEIENGYDIVTGRRRYKVDTEHPLNWLMRVMLSKTYVFLVKILLGVNFRDTETGYKFFNKRSILPILNEIEDKHWFWDTEVMVRSYYKGLKTEEVPVLFKKKWERTSKVNIINDTLDYLFKLIKFRFKVHRKYNFKVRS